MSSGMAAIQYQGQHDVMLGMAEQGAARLQRYGPQGRQWAQRLRANPEAALAMAEQFGGFQQIEAGLRYAEARGQGAAAESLAGIALETSGPPGYQQIMGGRAALTSADASLLDAQTAYRDAGRIDVPEVMKLRKEMGEQSKPFDIRRSFFMTAISAADRAAKLAEENNNISELGAADFALVQAMGKMIDPDSVVRNEEGRMIMEAGDSSVEAFIHKVNKWFGQTGVLSNQARLRLMQQIDAQYQVHLGGQIDRVGIFMDEIQNMGVISPRHLDLAVPDTADPSNFQELTFEFDAWEDAVSAETFDAAVADAKAGDLITDDDGHVWKKFIGPDGKPDIKPAGGGE